MFFSSKGMLLLLMAEILHQLRLVVYPMFIGFHTSQVVVWDFSHQQYDKHPKGFKVGHITE